jgi:hypothetical protein
MLLLVLAPAFLLFELWQLVMGERYLGIKQIARNGDPRALGIAELTAFLWTAVLASYLVWMAALVFVPTARLQGLCLLGVSALGYAFRRNSSIKWILVIMTFEGAIRMGLLVSLALAAWRHL